MALIFRPGRLELIRRYCVALCRCLRDSMGDGGTRGDKRGAGGVDDDARLQQVGSARGRQNTAGVMYFVLCGYFVVTPGQWILRIVKPFSRTRIVAQRAQSK